MPRPDGLARTAGYVAGGTLRNITLDVVAYNFGIQEWSAMNDHIREVFEGCPEMKNGYMYPNDKPGWGIEVDEKAAAKYPFGLWRVGRKKTAERRLG